MRCRPAWWRRWRAALRAGTIESARSLGFDADIGSLAPGKLADLVVLDEPTVGVDPQSRNLIFENIRALSAQGRTVVYTTHYMEEADKVASRIAVIDHGKIIALGSSAELKEQTKTSNLEDAFLALTGNVIRDEDASAADGMRQMHRAWRGGRR